MDRGQVTIEVERTSNVFCAVLGGTAVKWDAFWHFFEWLVDPRQGHGLEDSVRSRLVTFAFGECEECEVKREYAVSGQKDGKGKWADFALGIPDFESPRCLIVMDDIARRNSGSMRKLKNLTSYIECSAKKCPVVRAIAVTDASSPDELNPVVFKELGAEASDFHSQSGWRLLTLKTIGKWVEESMNIPAKCPDGKMRMILGDFVEWCRVPGVLRAE